MKLRLFKTNQFKRSYRRLKLKDSDEEHLITILYKLLNGIELDRRYCDHALKGQLSGYRECHIRPDLLLVYRTEEGYLKLVDIGSHSELFD